MKKNHLSHLQEMLGPRYSVVGPRGKLPAPPPPQGEVEEARLIGRESFGSGWVCRKHGSFWLVNKKGSNCPKCGKPAARFLGRWTKKYITPPS